MNPTTTEVAEQTSLAPVVAAVDSALLTKVGIGVSRVDNRIDVHIPDDPVATLANSIEAVPNTAIDTLLLADVNPKVVPGNTKNQLLQNGQPLGVIAAYEAIMQAQVISITEAEVDKNVREQAAAKLEQKKADAQTALKTAQEGKLTSQTEIAKLEQRLTELQNDIAAVQQAVEADEQAIHASVNKIQSDLKAAAQDPAKAGELIKQITGKTPVSETKGLFGLGRKMQINDAYGSDTSTAVGALCAAVNGEGISSGTVSVSLEQSAAQLTNALTHDQRMDLIRLAAATPGSTFDYMTFMTQVNKFPQDKENIVKGVAGKMLVAATVSEWGKKPDQQAPQTQNKATVLTGLIQKIPEVLNTRLKAAYLDSHPDVKARKEQLTTSQREQITAGQQMTTHRAELAQYESTIASSSQGTTPENQASAKVANDVRTALEETIHGIKPGQSIKAQSQLIAQVVVAETAGLADKSYDSLVPVIAKALIDGSQDKLDHEQQLLVKPLLERALRNKSSDQVPLDGIQYPLDTRYVDRVRSALAGVLQGTVLLQSYDRPQCTAYSDSSIITAAPTPASVPFDILTRACSTHGQNPGSETTFSVLPLESLMGVDQGEMTFSAGSQDAKAFEKMRVRVDGVTVRLVVAPNTGREKTFLLTHDRITDGRGDPVAPHEFYNYTGFIKGGTGKMSGPERQKAMKTGYLLIDKPTTT